MTFVPCECKTPGFCQRYQIEQNQRAIDLCSGQAKGPGYAESYQERWSRDLAKRTGSGPSIAQKVRNVGVAGAAAAAGFVQGVPVYCPDDVAQARSLVCFGDGDKIPKCDFCDVDNGTCTHPRCGCPLRRVLGAFGRPGKVHVSTQSCPMGKWGPWAPPEAPISNVVAPPNDGTIRSITVCVGYDDMLAVTLPLNSRHVRESIVITDSRDEATAAIVASVPNARLHVTDVFYKNGAVFNKGAALEEAFEAMGRSGRLMIWDADILLPDVVSFPASLDGMLHGAKRRFVDDPDAWFPGYDWAHSRRGNDPAFIGYLQLFDAEDPALKNRPWYDDRSNDASGADMRFANRWGRNKRRLLDFEVLHLGPTGKNWKGRVTRRRCGPIPSVHSAAGPL